MLQVCLTFRAQPRAALDNPAIHPDAPAPIDGCSAVLDGPSNEPAPNQNARECHDVSNNPQSGAMATDWPAPKTRIARTAVKTSATVEEPNPLERGMGQPMD